MVDIHFNFICNTQRSNRIDRLICKSKDSKRHSKSSVDLNNIL